VVTSPFACRACDATSTSVLLEMGRLPLADAFVASADATDDRFTETLTLVMCDACRLVQIREEVPRDKLFRSYLWVSGTSETARRHAAWLSERLRARHHRQPRPFLVEVASNDGFFLEHYRRVGGFDILGVDPSNLALEADQQGIPSVRDFFGAAAAGRIKVERGPADVIVARNVLGHASALQDLVGGVKQLLAPDGVFVLEVPYAYYMRAEIQYDTIFHEHLSYPTIRSVGTLMRRFGLKITDISFVQMNGGSMLCEIVHETSAIPRNDQAMLDFEESIDLNTPRGWRGFAAAVEAQRDSFVALLERLAAERKRVAAYGAAAKCMTMLNYCGVSTNLISVIGDANPRKQGLLCPGVRIPVVSPAEVMARDPDYVMIGAWNFKDEIMQFFREKLGYRSRFIVPLPMPTVEE
jgi:novobiocin biosynthesis protein NovU/D-mycarose 3-C-methyltransferase